MERIASLIEQLQEAHRRQEPATVLLAITLRLQAELQQSGAAKSASPGSGRVAVVMPATVATVTPGVPEPAVVSQPAEAEAVLPRIVEVLEVNEVEVEAELEEIRQKKAFAEQMQAQHTNLKPGFLFEEEEVEVPTLFHQPNYQPPAPREETARELNEVLQLDQSSLNEQLHAGQQDVAHRLRETPVKDLKKAIGINDRFVFINELFRGDESMYERSIKTINNFSILAEAEYWIERELKIKLGWDTASQQVQEFYSLVKRRFS